METYENFCNLPKTSFFINTQKILGQGTAKIFKSYYKFPKTDLKKPLAAKITKHSSNDPANFKKAKHEVSILKSCHHPNIISLFDREFISKEEVIFFTELFSCDLSQKMNGNISEDMALNYAEQILSGLCYLHSKEIIHRDMKPENILLRDDGTLVLCDFGESRSKEDKTSKNLVSIMYTAPECLQDNQYSNKSDIWAFGVVFYQLLYGKIPMKAFADLDKLHSEKFKGDFQEFSEKSRMILKGSLASKVKNRLSAEELLLLIQRKEEKLELIEDNYFSCLSTKEFSFLSNPTPRESLKVKEEKIMTMIFHRNLANAYRYLTNKLSNIFSDNIVGVFDFLMEGLLILHTFAMISEEKAFDLAKILEDKEIQESFYKRKNLFEGWLGIVEKDPETKHLITVEIKELRLSEKMRLFYSETLIKTINFFKSKVQNFYLIEKSLKKIDKRLIIIIRLLKNIMEIQKKQDGLVQERNCKCFDEFYKLEEEFPEDLNVLAKEIFS